MFNKMQTQVSKVSVLLGCSTPSLDDWPSAFRENVVVLYSSVEYSFFGHF
jgi:hypothetical protein